MIAAKRLGAEQVVLAGRHEARTDLGRAFGATDAVAERGDEGISRIRELTDVLDGIITPGRVFDQTFPLDQTPDAYRAMADRQVLKALITP